MLLELALVGSFHKQVLGAHVVKFEGTNTVASLTVIFSPVVDVSSYETWKVKPVVLPAGIGIA